MATRCDICDIDLANEQIFQEHVNGKKHQKKLRYVEMKTVIEEKSIHVSNWPQNLKADHLIDFFLKYGSIVNHKFKGDYALIQFENSDPVRYLTSRPIFMKNRKLQIKRRIFHENEKRTTDTDNKLTYEDVKSVFESETTFDSQLIAFLNSVQQNDVAVESVYGSICASLNQIFRTTFKNCKALRYGSTVTGLSFNKSDLDVYMDIGLPVYDADNCDVDPEEWTPKKVFRVAKSLLYRRKNIFTNIVPIPNAKTPIIKFLHAPTQIFCDISFKNSLGVHNSNLIKHYLSLDVRLKPLMIILKFWAHLSGITGTGKLSNYALIMLVIFALQQPGISMVPTVSRLQQNCPPKYVEGWQVSYAKDRSFEITNDSSIPKLLHEFFDFYAKFDFGSRLVCPLDGNIHPKTIFNEGETLPDSMARYQVYVNTTENPFAFNPNKPMCVEDPIEQNHNLTAGIGARAVDFFQKHCATSRQVCQEAQTTDYKNLLSKLFTSETILDADESHKLVIKGDAFLKIGLPPGSVLRPGVLYRDHFTIESWQNIVIDLTKDVLVKMFKLEIKVENSEREAKHQKCNVKSDVHSKDDTKTVLQCVGYHKLWHGRRKQAPLLDPSMTILEKEVVISDCLMEEFKKNAVSSVPVLDFLCIMEWQRNVAALEITLHTRKSPKSIFREFYRYISVKLSQIIEKTLQHMLQFKKVKESDCSARK